MKAYRFEEDVNAAAPMRPPNITEDEWRYRMAVEQAEDFEMLSPFRQIEVAAEREVEEDAESENKSIDEDV